MASIVWAQSGSIGASLLLPVAMIVIFYFLLIAPQQKKQKKWQEMLGQLKSGDKVTTSGGIQGTIISIKSTEDNAPGSLILRVPPDGIKLEIARNSIVSVKTDDEKSS
jgi:preprotein translocase subunit YajC